MSIIKKLGLTSTKWKSCQYKISVTIKFSDKTTRVLKPIQITGLYLEKDYDLDHLPVMLLNIAISKLDSNHIKDDLSTEFHVKIIKYYVEDVNTQQKTDSEIYINDTFVNIPLKVTPDSGAKLEKTIKELDNVKDDDVSVNDLTSQETYVLCRKRDLISSKVITNAVLKNVTMTDAIFYLLSCTNFKGRVLMSNLTNSTVHKELLLEARPLISQLIFLEDEYGWHKEGTYLFLDFGKLYIIRKNGKCTAWEKNEPNQVCFCISEISSSDTVPKGIVKKNNIVYINIGTDQYEVGDGSVATDQIEGSNMILTNTTTGETETVESGVNSSYDGGAYTTKTYHGHNPYVKEQFVRMMIENENQISITCLNGDLSYFTPNKQYSFVTDLTSIMKNFTGNYRLCSIKTTFVKNGDYFDSTSIMSVKRVEKKITY